MERFFKIVDSEFRKNNEDIILPKRATKHSAGYDFYSPVTIIIPSKMSVQIWTDVKCKVGKDEFLMIVPRSSVGIKKNLMLKNTTGIIDSDYFSNPDNDGNIGICFYNFGDVDQAIQQGDKICQGIFIKYFKTDEDGTNEERIGGTGSTDSK